MVLLFLYLLAVPVVTLADTDDIGAQHHGIEIRRVITGIENGCFEVESLAVSTIIVTQASDTLKRGSDYSYAKCMVTLNVPILNSDTLYLIAFSDSPLLRRQYSLRPFRTQLSTAPVADHEKSVVTRPTTPAGLKISGTKSFSADFSDRGRTNFSQGLALTLSGDIGHGIMVRGSFSDRGLRDSRLVTKRFSQLENVYLEVESEHLNGKFGNFELREDRFHYLRLVRNVQGLSLQYHSDNYSVESSLSLPPGNFATNSFTAVEGDYGPYRLKDKNDQIGIAVLENSETVWFNGSKLLRGRDQDYYVDYLQGELYFTGRMTIDSGDRIRVDFECRRAEYRKTLATGVVTGQLAGERLELGLGVASLVGSGDDPLDFSLTTEEKAQLGNAGDDAGKAMMSGAEYVGTGAGDYRLEIDSVIGEIYYFMGDSLGDYRVAFSESDSGDYFYLGGGEYRFVGPGLGRYLPVKSIPLPEGVTIASGRLGYHLSDRFKITTEAALSNYDRNRLSHLDDDDNFQAAGQVNLEYRNCSGRLSGSLAAEYLPAGFYRLSRLDYVEEDYLWQRDTKGQSDRQRYLARLSTRFSKYDQTAWEFGYTAEAGGFRGVRGNLQSKIEGLTGSSLTLDMNYTNSEDVNSDNKLFGLKPHLTCKLLPVQFDLSGEYDIRTCSPVSGQRSSSSRRELAVGAAYSGISISGRQKENWQKAAVWQRLDRKRTLLLRADRGLPGRGRLRFTAGINRLDDLSGGRQSYETGALDLIWPGLGDILSLNTKLRLNRRGRWQTNQTYLKVDEGEGDYVLIDSVYLPEARGDYILVTEQVGDVGSTLEAEKRMQMEVDLQELWGTIFTRGTFLRYDSHRREIGEVSSRFNGRWLLPQYGYFDDDAIRFVYQRHEYRLKRFDRFLGLRREITYRHRDEK
ncbi:MAG: hypothetical protein KAT58_06665, partial [candidate division Zixibacteria bacterium]|nr:hypothetical protein [candidate division Zixibacteria bacterium]